MSTRRMRLTKNNELGGYYSDYYGPEKQPEIQKLGKLEDIGDELGVDIAEFLSECMFVLKNASAVEGKSSKGNIIKTDFGYVEDFINQIKKELL